MNRILIAVVALVAASATFAADNPSSEAPQHAQDPVRNGCIETRRIRGFDVIDDRTVRLEIRGKADVDMRFSNRCPGTRFDPIVYETDGMGRLCERFDTVRVGRMGFCHIESLTAVVPDAAPADTHQPSD